MIPISPIDTYFYRPTLYTIQFVFEYRQAIETNALRNAVQTLSETFIASRYQIDLTHPFDVGFKLTQTPPPVGHQSISNHLDLSDPDNLTRLIDPVTNQPDVPLIRFLVTTTPSKSFVGVSFSHILGDGYSFMMYMTALSQVMTQGKPAILPDNNREKLIPATKREDVSSRLFQETGYAFDIKERPGQPVHRNIYFSRMELDQLKVEADLDHALKVTDNDVVMAELLRRLQGQIPVTETGKVAVRCPVDYRRSYPGLGPTYFGNAVKDALALFEPHEVPSLPLAAVVGRIRSAITAVNGTSILQTLKVLDQLRLEKGVDIFEHVGCPGLLVTNLSRLPFRDLNLGSGAPDAFYVATFPRRIAIILPATDGLTVSVTI